MVSTSEIYRVGLQTTAKIVFYLAEGSCLVKLDVLRPLAVTYRGRYRPRKLCFVGPDGRCAVSTGGAAQ